MRITKEDVRRELAKRSLKFYIKEMWHVVEGRKPFEDSFYIDVICEHLEAIFNSDIQNLIINIPPRHLKSLICCVFFPSWIWTNDASFRMIFAAYASALSKRDSIKTRNIIRSPLYSRWFLQNGAYGNFEESFSISDDMDQTSKFSNNKLGFRIATSVDGSATGDGGDLIVVDDPTSASQSHSVTARDNANFWYDQVFQNRLDDRRTGRRLIIMQRLHEKDLTGHILENHEGYEHLVIPVEYTTKRFLTTSLNWKDPRKEGEFLIPERYGEDQKRADLKAMGNAGYSGQMLQSPVPIGGGLIKKEWIRYYDVLPKEFDRIIISADLNFKKTKTSDYVCFQCWGLLGIYRYLIDIVRGRWNYPETKTNFKIFCEKHPKASKKYIEDKANGPALIADLENQIKGIEAWPTDSSEVPKGIDKVQRVHLISPDFENGLILLPKNMKITDEYEHELTSFTEKGSSTGNDDMVDTTTTALIELRTKSGSRFAAGAQLKNIRD